MTLGPSIRMHRLVTAECLADPVAAEMVSPPSEPWYCRTRRGAIYRALPPFRRSVVRDEMAWLEGHDRFAVIDKSAASRYLRPGTREHRQAAEALR